MTKKTDKHPLATKVDELGEIINDRKKLIKALIALEQDVTNPDSTADITWREVHSTRQRFDDTLKNIVLRGRDKKRAENISTELNKIHVNALGRLPKINEEFRKAVLKDQLLTIIFGDYSDDEKIEKLRDEGKEIESAESLKRILMNKLNGKIIALGLHATIKTEKEASNVDNFLRFINSQEDVNTLSDELAERLKPEELKQKEAREKAIKEFEEYFKDHPEGEFTLIIIFWDKNRKSDQEVNELKPYGYHLSEKQLSISIEALNSLSDFSEFLESEDTTREAFALYCNDKPIQLEKFVKDSEIYEELKEKLDIFKQQVKTQEPKIPSKIPSEAESENATLKQRIEEEFMQHDLLAAIFIIQKVSDLNAIGNKQPKGQQFQIKKFEDLIPIVDRVLKMQFPKEMQMPKNVLDWDELTKWLVERNITQEGVVALAAEIDIALLHNMQNSDITNPNLKVRAPGKPPITAPTTELTLILPPTKQDGDAEIKQKPAEQKPKEKKALTEKEEAELKKSTTEWKNFVRKLRNISELPIKRVITKALINNGFQSVIFPNIEAKQALKDCSPEKKITQKNFIQTVSETIKAIEKVVESTKAEFEKKKQEQEKEGAERAKKGTKKVIRKKPATAKPHAEKSHTPLPAAKPPNLQPPPAAQASVVSLPQPPAPAATAAKQTPIQTAAVAAAPMPVPVDLVKEAQKKIEYLQHFNRNQLKKEIAPLVDILNIDSGKYPESSEARQLLEELQDDITYIFENIDIDECKKLRGRKEKNDKTEEVSKKITELNDPESPKEYFETTILPLLSEKDQDEYNKKPEEEEEKEAEPETPTTDELIELIETNRELRKIISGLDELRQSFVLGEKPFKITDEEHFEMMLKILLKKKDPIVRSATRKDMVKGYLKWFIKGNEDLFNEWNKDESPEIMIKLLTKIWGKMLKRLIG